MHHNLTNKLARHTWVVCGIYACIAIIWVLFSDRFLAALVDPEQITRLQSWKGILFVLVTSSLLFILINKKNHSIKTLFGEVENQMYHFQATFEQAAVGMVHISKDERWIRVNKRACDILGYTRQEFKTLSLEDMVHPDDLEKGRELDQKVADGELDSYVMEKRYLTKSGKVTFTRLTKSAVREANGQLRYLIAIIEEINTQKEAEYKLRKSLDEKEKLLAEIHHRVKNNLAVISGLMELQIYNTKNKRVIGVLKKSMLRIKSMALIHESYYEKGRLSHVTIDSYLMDFIRYIQNAYSDANHKIEVKLDTEPLQMNINQAIPCGLLLTELLIEFYSSHMEVDRETVVRVLFRHSDDDFVTLTVKSNLTAGSDTAESELSGPMAQTIINALVRQLNGTLSIVSATSSDGTVIKTTFKLDSTKKGSANAYMTSGN